MVKGLDLLVEVEEGDLEQACQLGADRALADTGDAGEQDPRHGHRPSGRVAAHNGPGVSPIPKRSVSVAHAPVDAHCLPLGGDHPRDQGISSPPTQSMLMPAVRRRRVARAAA